MRVIVSSSIQPRLAERLDDLAKAGERTRSKEVQRAIQMYVAVRDLERDDEKEEES
jgi:predicted transcriptional regulator